MSVKNKVQLITYPDSIGGDLKSLHHHLNTHFSGVFEGGIHILPPYPSSGDRGFAPVSYFKINPDFGDWNDIQSLAKEYDILLDFMINHISKESEYFQDFLRNGEQSKYADLFLSIDKIWTDGKPVQEDIEKMFLRRPLPYSVYQIGEEKKEVKVWTSFGKTDPSEQIDLDVFSEVSHNFFEKIFKFFAENHVKIVRLDAIGYVTKKLGTSCFFVEPEIYAFLSKIKNMADQYGIELLPEVHAQYKTQYKLAEKGYWIYDFILPYYVLKSLLIHKVSNLFHYLSNRPQRQFTMLDCHDGIPIKPDLDDLVSTKDAKKVVDHCLKQGANLSLLYSDKHKSADGFDVHQIRCTYYSALNENDDAYLLARAIQFFTPGIPQVYYVGLLAGSNDFTRVNDTGEGREINRHNFTNAEIESAVKKPVVKRLMKLIRFRNTYEAFNGRFSIKMHDKDVLEMKWTNKDKTCKLVANASTYLSEIYFTGNKGKEELFFI
jgi:sucrose phosphorylase